MVPGTFVLVLPSAKHCENLKVSRKSSSHVCFKRARAHLKTRVTFLVGHPVTNKPAFFPTVVSMVEKDCVYGDVRNSLLSLIPVAKNFALYLRVCSFVHTVLEGEKFFVQRTFM